MWLWRAVVQFVSQDCSMSEKWQGEVTFPLDTDGNAQHMWNIVFLFLFSQSQKKNIGCDSLSGGKSCLFSSKAQKSEWIFLGGGSGIYNKTWIKCWACSHIWFHFDPHMVLLYSSVYRKMARRCGSWMVLAEKGPLTSDSYWAISEDCQQAWRRGWAAFILVLRTAPPPHPPFRKPPAFTRQCVILADLLPLLCWRPRGISWAGCFVTQEHKKQGWMDSCSLSFTLQDVTVLESCLWCLLIGYMIRVGWGQRPVNHRGVLFQPVQQL